MNKNHIFFVTVASLSLFSLVYSVQASDPKSNLTVMDRSFSGDPKGFNLGKIAITPILTNTIEYTSNIFRSENDETDDEILKTRLDILAVSDQGRSSTTLNLQGDYWAHAKTEDLNRGGYMGILYHQYTISPVASVGFRAAAEKDYQTSYDAATSAVLFEPIEVDKYTAGVDLNLNPGSINWQLSSEFYDYSYQDAELLNSSDILVQSDRDKQAYNVSVTANFEKFSKFNDQGATPFLGFSYTRENYDRLAYNSITDDFTGRDRSNNDYDLVAGVHLRPTGKFRGKLQAGVGYFDPDDGQVDDDLTNTIDMDLTYLHTPLTNFLFGAQRFFNTDTDNAEVAVQTELNAEVIHELTRMWILRAGVRYIDRDFDGDGNDELWDTSVGFRHHINDRFSLDGSVRLFSRDADDPANDFDETRTMLRLRTKL